ncbi:hypothetical protein F5Y03DRAFT_352133 [Xylaria venustula]|nr:hypothetical protein F5Y03DRAFT_352133 [Xylaria venustula]
MRPYLLVSLHLRLSFFSSLNTSLLSHYPPSPPSRREFVARQRPHQQSSHSISPASCRPDRRCLPPPPPPPLPLSLH